jgi:aspartokinase-like uncharacterized kinase
LQPSCVIKIGGSLLGLADLPARLANVLTDFSRPLPVAMCGGGKAVDLIRAWDRLYTLGEEASHWIAVLALGVNARVVSKIVPILDHVVDAAEFPRIWSRRKVPLYDAMAFLEREDAHRSDPLPRRWRVTSDSIAARMAVLLGAPELILLKSITPRDGTTREEAARLGIVDPYFPMAARDGSSS